MWFNLLFFIEVLMDYRVILKGRLGIKWCCWFGVVERFMCWVIGEKGSLVEKGNLEF